MDRLNKFLKKLNDDERDKIFIILGKVVTSNIDALDIKKLKGFKNLYRVRDGDIRIIFERESKHYFPLNIDYRKNIYKNM